MVQDSRFESFLGEGGARGANGGSSKAARQARAPLRSGSITTIKLFSDHLKLIAGSKSSRH